MRRVALILALLGGSALSAHAQLPTAYPLASAINGSDLIYCAQATSVPGHYSQHECSVAQIASTSSAALTGAAFTGPFGLTTVQDYVPEGVPITKIDGAGYGGPPNPALGYNFPTTVLAPGHYFTGGDQSISACQFQSGTGCRNSPSDSINDNELFSDLEVMVDHNAYRNKWGHTIEAYSNRGQWDPWVKSNAYAVDDLILSNGRIYDATQAGTSASSGAGPIGTGQAVVDGSVTWKFVGYQSGVSDWAASTAYAVGALANSDRTPSATFGSVATKIYIATTAGTSASSGGPTGTGSSISDGSVVWAYECTIGADNCHAPAGGTFLPLNITYMADTKSGSSWAADINMVMAPGAHGELYRGLEIDLSNSSGDCRLMGIYGGVRSYYSDCKGLWVQAGGGGENTIGVEVSGYPGSTYNWRAGFNVSNGYGTNRNVEETDYNTDSSAHWGYAVCYNSGFSAAHACSHDNGAFVDFSHSRIGFAANGQYDVAAIDISLASILTSIALNMQVDQKVCFSNQAFCQVYKSADNRFHVTGTLGSDVFILDNAGGPSFPGLTVSSNAQGGTYANDAAAAAAGIGVGQLYRNGSIVQIRVS